MNLPPPFGGMCRRARQFIHMLKEEGQAALLKMSQDTLDGGRKSCWFEARLEDTIEETVGKRQPYMLR